MNTAPDQLQREAWLVDLIRLQRADPLLTTPDERSAAKRAALTVHLLGGCPMADDPRHGVVDAAGRVHRPGHGVHSGLYIVDGSTCATSLGVNPSLGIAALAEHALELTRSEVARCCHVSASRCSRRWWPTSSSCTGTPTAWTTTSSSSRPGPPPASTSSRSICRRTAPRRPGASTRGRRPTSPALVGTLDRRYGAADRPLVLAGWSFGGLLVTRIVQEPRHLAVPGRAAPAVDGRRLRYRLAAETSTGHRVDVAGVKLVTGPPWRWWADTTRMYVVLSTVDPARPDEPAGLCGTVRITLPAFARQLTTLRGRPGDVLRFVARFAARLLRPASRPG